MKVITSQNCLTIATAPGAKNADKSRVPLQPEPARGRGRGRSESDADS